MWILDPLSIATDGYIGIGPIAGDFCPLPLAIATIGYVRFEVRARVNIFAGDGGTGVQRKEAELLMTLAPAIIEAIETIESDD